MRHKHVEQHVDEYFLGNSTVANFLCPKLAAIETLRLGINAFDINGNRLAADEELFPLFIHESDYTAYNRIMTAQFNEIRRGFYRHRPPSYF